MSFNPEKLLEEIRKGLELQERGQIRGVLVTRIARLAEPQVILVPNNFEPHIAESDRESRLLETRNLN